MLVFVDFGLGAEDDSDPGAAGAVFGVRLAMVDDVFGHVGNDAVRSHAMVDIDRAISAEDAQADAADLPIPLEFEVFMDVVQQNGICAERGFVIGLGVLARG